MNKKLVIANWKMNLNTHEASTLVHRLHEQIPTHRSVEVVIAPSLLTLQPLSVEIDRHKFKLAAQNAYHKDSGAFTGEVSFTMLRHIVQYALVGHSERRIYFDETLEVVRDKVAAAVRNDIIPVLCIGETADERAAGETNRVLHDQVTSALSSLTSEDIDRIVIAYEPVWAISSFGGQLAKPEDIREAIGVIRNNITELYGADAAKQVRVLYGGSVNGENVGGYLAITGCDGVLVGSASLSYPQFSHIVEAAYLQASQEQSHDG